MTRSTSTEVDQVPGLDDTETAVVPDAVVAVHTAEADLTAAIKHLEQAPRYDAPHGS